MLSDAHSHACVSNSYKKIKYVSSFSSLADIKCKQTHILFIVRIVEGQSELLFSNRWKKLNLSVHCNVLTSFSLFTSNDRSVDKKSCTIEPKPLWSYYEK